MDTYRITLVVPPGLAGMTPNREAAAGLGSSEPGAKAFRYPPHTAAAVAGGLRGAGYDVRVIDAVARGLDVDACVQAVVGSSPALVGVSVSWGTRQADKCFLARIARIASWPTVAFGISTRHMRDALRDADHVLEGEPEGAFPTLCESLLTGKVDLPHTVTPAILGVAGYDPRGLFRDLDALPIPAWDLFPIEQYPYLSVLSSRGCRDACSWCPYVVAQGRQYRACSPKRVVAELRDLVRRHAPSRVVFRDPVFAFDRDRAAEICRLVLNDATLRPGKALRWECESRPEHFDAALLRLMSLAGCVGIKVGLETTAGRILCREGRLAAASDVESYFAKIRSLTRECTRLGMACRLFAMAGLPGQTLEMAQDTADFGRDARPHGFSARAVKRYPEVRLPSPAPCEEAIQAQLDVLNRAGAYLRRNPPPTPSRWRRAFLRASYRRVKLGQRREI